MMRLRCPLTTVPSTREPSRRSPDVGPRLLGLAFPASLLWVYFVLLVVFFEVQRLGILLRHWGYFVTGTPPAQLLASFYHGLRLDQVAAGYLTLPPAVLALGLAVAGVSPGTILRWVVRLMGVLLLVAAVAGWAELEFFGHYRDRYTAVVVEYLDTPGIVWQTIWAAYHPLGVLALSIATWWLLRRALLAAGRSLLGNGSRWVMAAGIAASVGLDLLLISGGWGWGNIPPRWGAAYWSRYTQVNQLTLNGLFSLATDVHGWWSDDSRWEDADHYYPDAQAFERARALLLNANERYVDLPGTPFAKISESRPRDVLRADRPNIVLIVLESFSAQAVGVLGGPIASTPEFDRLAADGVLFARYFAQANRTGKAIFSIMTGMPAPPGRSILKTPVGRQRFTTLASVFKEHGYRTRFVYGGDLMFDNLAGFLPHNGFDELIGLDDFPDARRWQSLTKWGIPDHLVLERVHDLLREPDPPTLTVVVTLTNHPPFILPADAPRPFTGRLAAERNAQYYTDWAIGRFFERARSSAYFDNTLFVLVGDHAQFYKGVPASTISVFHVPCLFYGPKVLGPSPVRIDDVSGHMDLAPTLVGLLGWRVQHAFWGRDLFHAPAGPSRLIAANNSVMFLIEDGRVVRDDPRTTPTVYTYQRPDRWTLAGELALDDPLVVKERTLTQVLRRVTSPRPVPAAGWRR